MKLILLRKIVGTLPHGGPVTYDKENGFTYPMISSPTNNHYQTYPGFAFVEKEALDIHLKEKNPSWLPFKQKRIL